MPKEVYSKDEFVSLIDKAIECRVKRLSDCVKIKLRTKKYLYTYKAKPSEAEELLKMVKCPIKEF